MVVTESGANELVGGDKNYSFPTTLMGALYVDAIRGLEIRFPRSTYSAREQITREYGDYTVLAR